MAVADPIYPLVLPDSSDDEDDPPPLSALLEWVNKGAEVAEIRAELQSSVTGWKAELQKSLTSCETQLACADYSRLHAAACLLAHLRRGLLGLPAVQTAAALCVWAHLALGKEPPKPVFREAEETSELETVPEDSPLEIGGHAASVPLEPAAPEADEAQAVDLAESPQMVVTELEPVPEDSPLENESLPDLDPQPKPRKFRRGGGSSKGLAEVQAALEAEKAANARITELNETLQAEAESLSARNLQLEEESQALKARVGELEEALRHAESLKSTEEQLLGLMAVKERHVAAEEYTEVDAVQQAIDKLKQEQAENRLLGKDALKEMNRELMEVQNELLVTPRSRRKGLRGRASELEQGIEEVKGAIDMANETGWGEDQVTRVVGALQSASRESSPTHSRPRPASPAHSRPRPRAAPTTR
eukprot:TRINITY_DN6961_c0_g1_i3.p1 TRINITY_DN6961_c0_g1~~TRINITY_DN6961_c0_g1_i3.p1  ORF type:complete len:419 (+),score=121.15 TRINITY_DN6961_c0_g1_i3:32-1288(+)